MSDLFRRAMERGDAYAEAGKAVSEIKSRFPYLHDLLAGCRKTGDGVDRLPGSLRIFCNGGEIKGEVTGPEWIMRGYLIVPQGVLSFEAIESELAAGRIGWSVKTERLDPKTKVPY
jgi:hypothetical protein